MTRFDAEAPRERRKLFADAVVAHRRRGSDALVVEAARESGDPVRVRFSEKTFAVDCTGEERQRLTDLLGEFPECRVTDETETDGGTRARVGARADANRLAAFLDRTFGDVYGFGDDYRAWVVRL